jgi:hypothetical protein
LPRRQQICEDYNICEGDRPLCGMSGLRGAEPLTEADARHGRRGVPDAGDEAQALLAQREAALRELETALAQARERFQLTEDRLRRARAWAEQLAADRLALLRAEHELRLEAEAKLAAVMTSTSWRVINRLRSLLTPMPRLRRGLRAAAARVLFGRS